MSEYFARIVAALADRYTVTRELGAGGMATVYLAADLKHHRDVAIKVLRPELTATLGPERFHREIEIAARLQHPHILGLLDSGAAGGFLYYVMPFVEGVSLRERLTRSGELPVAEAVRILRDVVDALAYAHTKGVTHRDIKPENVMLSGRHALVTDFGVAKAVSAATGDQSLTTAGVALGTPAYMSPEQATADPQADHRSDIYSVGAMAYELITGSPPFAGTTAQMVLAKHVTEAPKPIMMQRAAIPPVLGGLIMRALEKRPSDRFQSAEDMLSQLEALGTPSGGITPSDTQPVRAHPARRQVARRAGIAAAIVVMTAVAWFGLKGRGTGTPAVSAARETTPSVAVLPFTELNQPAGQEYFADGLTEEVIAALSRMPSLRVPGRSSTMYFKGSRTPLRAIAESLNVRSMLTASIQRSGTRVRIRAELVKAADGFLLWSETYDENLENLFAVYDRVAQSIARALKVRLTEPAPGMASRADSARGAGFRKPTNAPAYNAYLLGRYHLNQRTAASIDSARISFERSIAADSGFALAWAGLAEAFALSTPAQYRVPGVNGEKALERSMAAAKRGVALAPSAAETHTSLAFVMDASYEWDDADREWSRALALDSSYAPMRHWYATHLAAQNRIDDAIREFRRAQELDELYWISGVWEALSLSAAGQHDAATSKLDALIARHPRIARLRSEAGFIAVRREDFTRAAAEYGMFFDMIGDSSRARQARTELPVPALRKAIVTALARGTFSGLGGPRGVDIAMYAGERAMAMELLDGLRARRGESAGATLRVQISHPELRRSERLQTLFRQMGMR